MLDRRRLLQLSGCLSMMPVLPAVAQEWPTRPVRLIVGTAAGGSPDVISRTIAERLSERLKQSIVVENLTQGAGAVAQHTTAHLPPDGHTMMMMTAGYPPQMILRKPTFHPLDGFSFVTLVCSYPLNYTVAPNSPIKSFPELLERARQNPGKLTYTINALGSGHHVLTKWIEFETGVEMTPISYRGAGPALTDVLGGRVDIMVEPATTSYPRVKAGQVRLLAHSGPAQYPLMPEARSVGEFVKGIQFMSWLGYVMPPKTPRAIVDRMNREIHAVLKLPDVERRFVAGGNLITPSTPEQMRDRVTNEMELWGRIIEKAGIAPKK